MRRYYINLSASNCKYEIKINDFILFDDKQGLQFSGEHPINHLLVDDKIHINLVLSPIENQTFLTDIVQFDFYIKVLDEINPENKIFEYTFDEDKLNLSKKRVVDVAAIKKQDYIRWYDGEKLELNDKLLKDLNDSYKSIWSAFHDGDMKKIASLFYERDKNYASCFFESERNRVQQTKSTYSNLIESPANQLADFAPQHFTPKIQCFGKLVCLEEKNGFHPVFFVKGNNELFINIPVHFARLNEKLIPVL